jgi:hypothetical protein
LKFLAPAPPVSKNRRANWLTIAGVPLRRHRNLISVQNLLAKNNDSKEDWSVVGH